MNDSMNDRIRDHLGQQHRFDHCVRVAEMASVLAAVHGEDADRAYLGGMLHDLARLYSADRLLEESQKRGVEIDAYARENPVVLHAPLSAQIARDDFGIDDAEVLSAIAKHTLAHPRMSPLDCILYLADSLEPGRKFAERESLARLAHRNLFGATVATIRSSLQYLKQGRTGAAPQTLAALQALEHS